MISRFDPWRGSLCTCPPKLTFNPYSGCDHHCVYCYASSYVPRFAECRTKKISLTALRREAANLKGETVSLCNSSDPYPRTETAAGLTRKCLEILAESNCKIQIITKSSMVTRDADLLCRVPATVAFTVTTDDDELAKVLEPDAPAPSERLKAAADFAARGIPVAVRIDPIIPGVNDNPEKLVAALSGVGVRHITSSTYKAKPDNWRRLSTAFPEAAEKLKPLLFQQGERVGGNTLLPKELRYALMKRVRDAALANGMKFGACREGFPQLNTASCDGSWLIAAEAR